MQWRIKSVFFSYPISQDIFGKNFIGDLKKHITYFKSSCASISLVLANTSAM